MFTYTTLFLGSFILAVVAIFVFKVVVDTRKAIKKSKQRAEVIGRAPTHQYEGAARVAGAGAGAGAQFPPGDMGGEMSWHAAKSTPAAPDQRAIVESHGSGVAFPGHPVIQNKGPRKVKSCSLYDVGNVETNVVNDSGDLSYEVSTHGPFDDLKD